MLLGIEGLQFDGLKKHRRREAEYSGACYYGSHYFNPSDVSGNCPELQLTRTAPRASIRFDRDLFSAWVMGYGDLQLLVKRPCDALVDWTFYCFCFLDDDGHVIVFPSNRPEFATALASVTGTRCVWSCKALRDGREPDWQHLVDPGVH